VVAGRPLAGTLSGRMVVAFGVACGQDASEIGLDVEAIFGSDSSDVDAENAPELTLGAAESPTRPMPRMTAVTSCGELLTWEPINLTGDYVWQRPGESKGEIRSVS
jgi:hypothetical protein